MPSKSPVSRLHPTNTKSVGCGGRSYSTGLGSCEVGGRSQTVVLRNVRYRETNGGPGRCCRWLTFLCERHRLALPWFGWESFPRCWMEGKVPCSVGRCRVIEGGIADRSSKRSGGSTDQRLLDRAGLRYGVVLWCRLHRGSVGSSSLHAAIMHAAASPDLW